MRGTRVSAVDDDARDEALALLAQAAGILEADEVEGPFWQTGLAAIERFRLDGDPTGLFPFSPASGPANPISPDIELHVTDDKTVHGTITLDAIYNGPPFDTCHGGIVALIYDDLIGMAAMVGAGGGMTARLAIDYRKPTPLFKKIELTAWLESHEGRKFIAKGEMRCDGELLSEAEGLFIRPKGFAAGTATG
jgi:acyl-coenzyme A thioesterase PaaI-like protein